LTHFTHTVLHTHDRVTDIDSRRETDSQTYRIKWDDKMAPTVKFMFKTVLDRDMIRWHSTEIK